VSLLVAAGAAVTILATGLLIGLVNALIVLACFAASGAPMMIGSIKRYVDARAADEKAARQMVKEALDESPSPSRQE
jgi:divalent metal cation (Fe/Co/Zn/Cd) transporter